MIHMREKHLRIRKDPLAQVMIIMIIIKKNKNNENLIKIYLEPVGPGAFVLRRGGGRLPNSIPGSIQSSHHHTPYHIIPYFTYIEPYHIISYPICIEPYHIISYSIYHIIYQTISYHTISSSNSIPGNLPHHNDHHPLHRHHSPLKPLRFVGKIKCQVSLF